MITQSSSPSSADRHGDAETSANLAQPSRTSKTVQSKNSSRHPVDHERIERAVREILLAVGEDPDREGLLETPA